jgi:hypothetical protein
MDDMVLHQRQEHSTADAGSMLPCTWTCHPLREEPLLKSVALGTAIAGSAAVMTVSLGSLVYGAIAIVVLIWATMGYLLPTRYVVDDQGAAWKQVLWRRRSWQVWQRAVRHPDGIFLSPFRQANRLDAFRGVFLRFGAGVDADQIDACIRTHVAS